jgi:hypothetical protein
MDVRVIQEMCIFSTNEYLLDAEVKADVATCARQTLHVNLLFPFSHDATGWVAVGRLLISALACMLMFKLVASRHACDSAPPVHCCEDDIVCSVGWMLSRPTGHSVSSTVDKTNEAAVTVSLTTEFDLTLAVPGPASALNCRMPRWTQGESNVHHVHLVICVRWQPGPP